MKSRRPSPRKERGGTKPTPGPAKERLQLHQKQEAAAAKAGGLEESEGEEEEGGFGKWLRTGDGFQYLRFFVVLNSLAVFLTMGWPQISVSLQALYEFFTED